MSLACPALPALAAICLRLGINAPAVNEKNGAKKATSSFSIDTKIVCL